MASDGTISYDNAAVENSDRNEFIGSRGIEHETDSDYYFDEATGSYRHQYAEIDGAELERRITAGDDYNYTQEAYEDAVLEAYPQLPGALQWATDNLPDDFIVTYNEALEEGDLDTFYSHLEYLLSEYEDASSVVVEEEAVEEEEEDVQEDLTDEEQQVLQEAVEDLQAQEPQAELANEWQSLVDQYQETDPTFAAVAAATAAFHNGEASAEDAINYVLQNFPLADVARVYQHLMEQ